MAEIVLEVNERKEIGKNANHRLRAQGLIPGVVYGPTMDNWIVSIDPKSVVEILGSESGRNTIFSVKMGSNSENVVIKDFQLDPVKGDLVHVDFQKIDLRQKMSFQVPVEIIGTASGVKNQGGVLDVVLREIEVECLPSNVPDQVELDITELNIGDSLRVSDIEIDLKNVLLLTDPELVVVTISAPRAEEVEEVVEEPEVLTEAVEEEAEAEPSDQETSES